MAGRSPARFLAPLALVASAVALFVVVTNSDRDGAATRGGDAAGREVKGPTATPAGKRAGRKRRRNYTVKPGDTPSGIAEKTGVPLSEILRLNPDLDPQALSPGTRIKLRR